MGNFEGVTRVVTQNGARSPPLRFVFNIIIDPIRSSDEGPRSRRCRVDAFVSEDFASFYDREIRSLVGLTYVLSGSRTGAEHR